MSETLVRSEALSDTAVRLTCPIKRPMQRVYDAWLDAAQLAQWFVPGQGAVCEVHEMDATVGGRFRFTVGPPGKGVTAFGHYKTLDPPSKIVMSWAWEGIEGGVTSQVTLDFLPDGEGTILVLTHEQLADLESRDLHTQGWTGCLSAFHEYVTNH